MKKYTKPEVDIFEITDDVIVASTPIDPNHTGGAN